MTTTNKEKTMNTEPEHHQLLDETILEGKLFDGDEELQYQINKDLIDMKKSARKMHRNYCDQLCVVRGHLKAAMDDPKKDDKDYDTMKWRHVFATTLYKKLKTEHLASLAEIASKSYWELLANIRDQRQSQINRRNATPVPDTPWGDEWGEIAYNAYKQSSEGKSLVSGTDLPEWDSLDADIKAAWIEASRAVRQAERREAVDQS